MVNIYTSRTVTERVQPSGFGAFFGDPAPRYRNRTERSLGSGVIVDTEGHIATNNHVIENADQVRVQLADRRVAVAQVVGRDPDSDLALLKISLDHLPVMPFGHSDQLQVGDVVLAIGNPLGLSQTVTHGIVSATGRGQLGLATFENFIQTDAAINPGNSGGALINTRGELVGINTAIVAKTSGVEGIGFAIPVNMVRGVIHDLITTRQGGARLDRHHSRRISPTSRPASIGLAHGGVVLWSCTRTARPLDGGPAPGATSSPASTGAGQKLAGHPGAYRQHSARHHDQARQACAAARPSRRPSPCASAPGIFRDARMGNHRPHRPKPT